MGRSIEEEAMAQIQKMGVPQGYHSVTPYITVKDIAQSVDFYRRALGAEERMRLTTPDGKRALHSEVTISGSVVMLGEENAERGCVAPAGLKGHSGGLYLYVPDVDAVLIQAKSAGAKVTTPVTDMFWGDRVAEIEDPSGHRWNLATRKEDLSPKEVSERAQAWFASQAKPT
jgi:PhnB protein